MKKIILVAAIVALVLAAISCAPAPTPAPTAAPPTAAPAAPTTVSTTAAPTAAPTAGKPLKVGLLTDQTGALAIYGPMLENGFALGLDYATSGSNSVAGRPIQVLTRDTASKVDIGTQVARDLIEKENVDVLVGVPSSGVALAVNELAKQYKKIYIAQPAASADVTGKGFNPYVFRTSRNSDQDALTSVGLKTLGKTFVQIAPDYAFGYAGAQGFYTVVKGFGGTFAVNDSPDKVGAIYVPQDAKDFTPYLQKALDSKADVLILTWAGDFVPLYTQMQQLGVFKAMNVYTGFADNQSVKKTAAAAVGSTGLIVYHYSLPKNPINDWLAQHQVDKFKSPPDLFTEGGFTAAQMLVAGLKATNGDPDADKLIKVYENNFGFDGPKGKYSVRPYDHVMLQTMYVVKLKNVTDPDFKFYDLVSELKPEDTAPPCRLEGDFASRCPKK